MPTQEQWKKDLNSVLGSSKMISAPAPVPINTPRIPYAQVYGTPEAPTAPVRRITTPTPATSTPTPVTQTVNPLQKRADETSEQYKARTGVPSTPTPTVTKTQQQLDKEAGPQANNPFGYDYKGNRLSDPNATGAPTEIPSPYQGNERVRRITDINQRLSDAVGEAPSLAEIRAEKANQARIITDAIRAQYDRTLQGQREVNAGNEARTRALNISSGLAGSDFATSAAVSTEKKGGAALETISQERDAKINAILADVEDRASEQYQTQREQYMKDLEGDLGRQKALLEEDRARASEQINSFVKGGYSYSSMKEKEPAVLEQLKNELGVSDLQLETMFTQNGTEKYLNAIKLDNGSVLMIKQGPDGKIVQSEYTTDLSDNETFKEIDGVPYGMKKDPETGAISLRPIQGFDKGSKAALELQNKRLANQKLAMEIQKLGEDKNFPEEFQTSLANANAAIKGGADAMEVRRKLMTAYPEYRDVLKDFLPEPKSSLF